MKLSEKTLLIGAHMSIEGGLYRAPEKALSIGCTVLQLFTKSNRQWQAKPLSKEDCTLFKKSVKDAHIYSVVCHASYLINLASPNEQVRIRSINALVIELDRCHNLAIDYLVLHPGSSVGQEKEKGLELITQGLNEVFKKSPSKTMVLLETMAGQGSSLGSRFEEIAILLKNNTDKKRLGVCLDTCHVFAAGYDLRDKPGYEKMWKNFDDIIGIKHLKAMHINDSKKDLGSCVDRHEDVGKGKIGENFFAFLFNDFRFFSIPKILETPKETLKDDVQNIKIIKGLLTQKTKKLLNL